MIPARGDGSGIDGRAECHHNDGWTGREGPPGQENGRSGRLMDGGDGRD